MDIQPVRVVVTGHDADGQACVTSDSPANDVFHRGDRPVSLTDVWQMTSVPTPTDFDGRKGLLEPFNLTPSNGGVKLRVVQFDPEPQHTADRQDGHGIFSAMGAGDEHIPHARHPYMHRTESVDFGIVLQGSITMLLDSDDVEVSAGDVVVQRGTNHAWSNRGSEPCLIAFVLVDAQHSNSAAEQ